MFAINSTGIEAAAAHLNFSEIGLTEPGLKMVRFYNTLVVLIGLLGNTLVLSGLLDHKVMNIDMTSRILLQNLAITDIFYTLFQFVPSLTTLLCRRWIFGKWLCLIDHIGATVFATNEIHIIMCLSIYMTDNIVTGYDPQVLSCKVMKNTNYWLATFMMLYNIVIPILITLVANSITLCAIMRFCLQKQVATRPYRKATITILTISLAFLFSYLPFFILMFTPLFSSSLGALPEWYRLTAMYFLSVNIVCNPFIYAMVDREFICYIKELFLILIYKFLLCIDWAWSKWYGIDGYYHNGDMTTEMNSLELINMGNQRGYQYQPPNRHQNMIIDN